MEDNFRNALIIISAIVIAAIFIHGLWTIRKNRNPYKLKTNDTKVEPMSRDFDGKGFDQDGVGEARVVSGSALTGEIEHPPADEEIPNQPAPAPTYNDEPLPVDIAEQPMAADNPVPTTSESEIADELALESEPSVYQTPVTQAKPTAAVSTSAKTTSDASLKKNQIELNFDDSIDTSASGERKEPTFGSQPSDELETSDQTPTLEQPEIETEVIVLSVVMPQGQLMSGAALLPSLLTLGMKYGDMNIFHRHEDNAGNGKVTFSLANMMNPGTFDLDNMENFTTQGVSMFMTLPNAGDPFEVFEQMLAAAKQLAQEFNAQILDDKRSAMTKQTEQHYTSKIREFDRKQRIAQS
ncbi:cell division protein ZipA [Thalassotalea euphylliae]|uniref:Cell division protein ZipA n=2 Tax=Thalassotalea euphylliae TaxID=1655234 RepID=A0A3E0TWJ5_9GAMM|nr:cell division protein ZipA [Thalassotalea euphylliae]